tara:strand:- start:1603 stop:2706 length:1104 start_codon:yes stop_codon:yes gene_type:complete
MHPFLRFLNAARSLQRNQGLSKADILNFAKNEFGEITGLMRAQIDNLFKTKKPVGKKDPVFDNTVEKMQFDDAGKPFNPRDPLKKADGGRIGYAMGSEGIMQMASDPGIMDERNELSLELFKKPLDLLTPEEMDLLNDEVERLMQKFSKVDRGAPSIKLADGGITRVGLKDGVFKRGLKSITDTDTYKTLENKGFNTAVLMSEGFDEIYNLLSGIPFADGGRAAFKDGPPDPTKRKFMKAAVGIASMIPGIGMLGKGAKVAAPVVAKAAEISGPALAKIVETVMSLGKTISISGKRVKEMVTKKRLKDVEVEEDVMDGSYIIKKGDKEIYYKPGRRDEMGIDDDIIEVIDKTVTKKASGGIAGMLGE